jgi:hypothetical protein
MQGRIVNVQSKGRLSINFACPLLATIPVMALSYIIRETAAAASSTVANYAPFSFKYLIISGGIIAVSINHGPIKFTRTFFCHSVSCKFLINDYIADLEAPYSNAPGIVRYPAMLLLSIRT